MRKTDPVKHEQKRQDILRAAEDCFESKGFNASSVAEICAAAKISPGHLYHYFASKEDIVAALAGARLADATAGLQRMLDGPDPFGAFLKMLSGPKTANRAGVKPGEAALLLEILAEASRNPNIGKMVREQTRAIRSLLGDILRRGQEAGKVDPKLDPQIAATILGSVMVDATKAMSIRAPDLDRKKVSDMTALLIERFLLPR